MPLPAEEKKLFQGLPQLKTAVSVRWKLVILRFVCVHASACMKCIFDKKKIYPPDRAVIGVYDFALIYNSRNSHPLRPNGTWVSRGLKTNKNY